jgi:hypothetical protein
MEGTLVMVSEKWVWNTPAKDIIMPPFILLVLALVILACAFGYMTFRYEAERRAEAAMEKRRNQFHDRV